MEKTGAEEKGDHDEVVTDLEAFHHELQSSLGLVRQMVASWMPSDAQNTLGSAPGASAAEEPIPRGRPERLGLGATPARPYAANATADTAETKKLKSMMNGSKKRRKSEEPESVPSHASTSNTAATSTVPDQNGQEKEDEEDSRSRSISSKRAKTTTSLFHDKVDGVKGSSSSSAQAPGKNKKKKKQGSDTTTGDTFAAPALPKDHARPQSATRQLSPSHTPVPPSQPGSPSRVALVKPPYALPASLDEPSQDNGNEEEGDGEESVTTEATDSTLVVTPAGSPGPEKAKKKRKKKKKKGTAPEERIGNVVVSNSDKLFGDSVME